MVTRAEVACRAGVSVGTVSNVINKKAFVKLEYVERVKRAIEELNYVPDFNAKSLARRRNNHIGIALFEMTNPYHAEVIQGLEKYAAERDYMVTTFLLDNNTDKKYEVICERRLDALVNFMTNDLPRNFIETLKSQQTVLVNFNPQDSFVVVNDYSQSMLECMRLLRDYGHKKVAYLSSIDSLRYKADKRGEMFLLKRGEFGFDCADDLIFCNDDYMLHSEEIGYRLCGKLLSCHPDVTAIFCMNDLVAFGAMRKINESGLSCPHDISVLGCDDISLGEYFNPPLTTMSFDKMKHGASIAKKIIEKIENSECPYETIVVGSELKLRGSVAKCKYER